MVKEEVGMKNKLKATIPFILIILLMLSNIVLADDWYEGEEGYFTIYDQGTNEVLFMTARSVSDGDEYISGDNKLYKIIKIEDNDYIAYAEYQEDITLPEISVVDQSALALMLQREDRRVGIFHTHSAESYVLSDGTDSIDGRGGIYKVGEAMERGLEANDVEVIRSEELHLPHDAGAYRRSRATKEEILMEGPSAVFDVHRDAIPPEQYAFELDGEEATKVRLVLGQRNQNIEKNRNLAYKLKAVADEMYPGMFKDIFIGKGNYNQDMAPNTILLEMGAHKNTREAAERTAEAFADVITVAVFGGQKEVATEDSQGETTTKTVENTEPAETDDTGSGRGMFIVLGIAAVLGIGFLFVSSSGKELKARFGDRFSNFLGRK